MVLVRGWSYGGGSDPPHRYFPLGGFPPDLAAGEAERERASSVPATRLPIGRRRRSLFFSLLLLFFLPLLPESWDDREQQQFRGRQAIRSARAKVQDLFSSPLAVFLEYPSLRFLIREIYPIPILSFFLRFWFLLGFLHRGFYFLLFFLSFFTYTSFCWHLLVFSFISFDCILFGVSFCFFFFFFF